MNRPPCAACLVCGCAGRIVSFTPYPIPCTRFPVALTESSAGQRAKILAEALPYIRRFYGKTIVVKYGGNAMTDERLKHSFARDVVLLKLVGMNRWWCTAALPRSMNCCSASARKASSSKACGVTDGETMDVVEMVLGGLVNKDIVNLINQHGGRAIGLTGKDGAFIRARKMLVPSQDNEAGDAGHRAGRRGRQHRSEIVTLLETREFIPVVAPIGVGADGKSYNINADLVAGSCRVLKAEKLVLLTNNARGAG